jgi:hypothetical protein
MECPPWLQCATVHPEFAYMFIEDPPATDTLPALSLALECAKKAIISPTGTEAFTESCDRQRCSRETLEEQMQSLEIYIVNWTGAPQDLPNPTRNPFHVALEYSTWGTSHFPVAMGNIFVESGVCSSYSLV